MRRFILFASVVLVSCRLHAQEKAPSLKIALPPGFSVELIRAAEEGEDSWISMTFDDRGRILLGLDKQGVGRLSFSAKEGTSEFEKLDDTLKHCRGVLYAHESLYVSATDSKGFYRLRDTNGDDRFDEKKLLLELDYRSRYGHGSNQIVLGPDRMIYLICGNDVSFPEGFAENSPYRNPHNDKLLHYEFDAGHDNRVGFFLKLDPDGGTREIVAGGFRNQVDLAFNQDGEMFTYDADMEWDAGLPWYRPTRLNHVVSGGEYGWRWGTMKWPTYYQDSLPTTLDTGYGSPTGIVFGSQSRFPPRYRDALFMADWQNGRIYLVDLIPDGASYGAEYDIFLQGGPLNVCDLTFGPDGALYFITGGRGSKSGLYRVTWNGDQPEPKLPAYLTSINQDAKNFAALSRATRRQLETFQTTKDPVAIDAAWHQLASEDRWLRSAARIALENQDVALWKDRALEQTSPLGSMTALIALTRVAELEDQPAILAALERQNLETMELEPLLGFLRAYALTFIGQGRPSDEVCEKTAQRLDTLFPHRDTLVNRELSELLVYLNSPQALSKTLALLEHATTQEEQFHYAMTLTHVAEGWTLSQRMQIFDWLQRARRFPGGKLVKQTVQNLILAYRSALSDEEKSALAEQLDRLEQPLADDAPAISYPIVQRWTMDDLANDLAKITAPRDSSAGERALAKASCLKCHRIGETGGRVGPDLSQVGARFDLRAILESVLEPSKVIDEKHRQTSYVLTNGKVITGRPIGVNAKQLVIETDPITEASVTVSRDEIEESVISKVSPMPAGLADVLTRDEILDLIAYLKFRH
ncbi:MAG TPA: heme-binding protein [Planctomycetaceae bacterium]|nr:heme-binding protein [Planctomycetaceae bacterium]